MGYSGHAYVVADIALANNYSIKGYFDFQKSLKNPYKIHFLGNENEVDVPKIIADAAVFPAIGSNLIREKVTNFIIKNGLKQIRLFAPSSFISNNAEIESSTVIGPNAVVNSLSTIGLGSIINSGAIVEHECSLGSFSHLAPGAILAGNVKVGKRTFIGANAVVKQGVEIGDNVVIGAGCVVIEDIPSNGTWVGNPARNITKHAK
nr:acetyltransferase [Eudoraea chungangensis]